MERPAVDLSCWKYRIIMPAPAKSIDNESNLRVLNSDELFEGGQEIAIVHKGISYRLRITRQDKLILTK